MSRDELLQFARWLLKDEFGEGREEEIVDQYLADRSAASRDCPNCSHPLHASECGYALTQTFRDDVGFIAKPSGMEITEIVGTCKCFGLPQ